MPDQPAPVLTAEAIQHTMAKLVHGIEALTFRMAASAALGACLDQDDDLAAQRLDGFTPDQLHRIENAAVALSLHASRLRGPLDDHERDEPTDGPLTVADQVAAADYRAFFDRRPDYFREFLTREIRHNPAWWRATLRRELRAGLT
ncbi:hypothetical protein [Actinomadura macra]|uniref:hypothetical protein n=1 Tax=Actinomadura macra TaxID=46164 RepID=UPI0008348A2E|nr:hypothetical protein [Actinomadura macra]